MSDNNRYDLMSIIVAVDNDIWTYRRSLFTVYHIKPFKNELTKNKCLIQYSKEMKM